MFVSGAAPLSLQDSGVGLSHLPRTSRHNLEWDRSFLGRRSAACRTLGRALLHLATAGWMTAPVSWTQLVHQSVGRVSL